MEDEGDISELDAAIPLRLRRPTEVWQTMARHALPLIGALVCAGGAGAVLAQPTELPTGAVVIYSSAVRAKRARNTSPQLTGPVNALAYMSRDDRQTIAPSIYELPQGTQVLFVEPRRRPALASNSYLTRSSYANLANVEPAIRMASIRHGLSAALIEAVAWQESRFDPDRVSQKGARGVMQLMPGTAEQLGVDARDVSANIDGGASYLAGLLRRFSGDVRLALAAYNAGPRAVERYRDVPPYPETQAYVRAVLRRLGTD